MTAWRNLLEESGTKRQLITNLKDLLKPIAITQQPKTHRKPGRRKNDKLRSGKNRNKVKVEEKVRNIKVNQINLDENIIDTIDIDNETYFRMENQSIGWEYGTNLSFVSDEKDQKYVHNKAKWADLRKPKPPSQKLNIQDGFFCDSPSNYKN